MNRFGMSLPRVAIGVVALTLGVLWGGFIQPGSVSTRSFVASAFAWIGHPATPVSYAGVARRTTRRMYMAGRPY